MKIKIFLFSFLYFIAIVSFGQPPSNDECSSAILLPVNNDNSNNVVYSGNTGYSTQSLPSCFASGYGAKDVWFKFVATASTHRITVTPTGSNRCAFEVFSGICGSLVSLACAHTGALYDPDVALLNNLIPGDTYYLRLWDYYGEGTPTRTFDICINTATVFVDNDDCINAAVVVPSPDVNYSSSVNCYNYGATQSMPGCFATADGDVWFKFTAVNSRQKIIVWTNEIMSPVLEIFNGSCGNLTSMACRYTGNGGDDYYVDADISTFIPGNTYYYRIYGGNNVRTTITTFILTLPSPPLNDECSGAIMLAVNNNTSCTNIYSGNVGYSTQSLPSCMATGFDAKDIWFKFVATAATHTIAVTSTSSDFYLCQVYKGSCENLVSLACTDLGNSGTVSLNNLIVGNTYYLRLWDHYGGGSVYRTFTVCITTSSTVIDNDECINSLTVIPSIDANPGTAINSNNYAATQSRPGCLGIAEDDVWFKFTATHRRHRIFVQTADNISPVIEVFMGNCGSLSSIGCQNSGSGGGGNYVDADISYFTPGITYYYRVYGSPGDNIRTNISTYITTPPVSVPVCQNGGVLLMTDIYGSSYQWQVNTGSGFVNVPNDPNYSVSNTIDLDIYQAPSSMYGYQYRCLVDSAYSSIFTLIFHNSWYGPVDSSWENPANWSCSVLPDSNTDVIIQSGNVIVNSNRSCRSISTNPGTSVKVKSGYTLTVTH
ncbi:MAG: hypothetical protein Q8941_18655 [Bacteroidota bacterium]|nr:hypothetical protein [Bacteroidota bacterium]